MPHANRAPQHIAHHAHLHKISHFTQITQAHSAQRTARFHRAVDPHSSVDLHSRRNACGRLGWLPDRRNSCSRSPSPSGPALLSQLMRSSWVAPRSAQFMQPIPIAQWTCTPIATHAVVLGGSQIGATHAADPHRPVDLQSYPNSCRRLGWLPDRRNSCNRSTSPSGSALPTQSMWSFNLGSLPHHYCRGSGNIGFGLDGGMPAASLALLGYGYRSYRQSLGLGEDIRRLFLPPQASRISPVPERNPHSFYMVTSA
ncbi:hypothetical protein B0H10DRAFT_1961377 [Mycena sp. CBHHK59/15]|nr:hypothetical protein B0H10DRAFT_1961377 [Mycena sp. CBHHK59/15]